MSQKELKCLLITSKVRAKWSQSITLAHGKGSASKFAWQVATESKTNVSLAGNFFFTGLRQFRFNTHTMHKLNLHTQIINARLLQRDLNFSHLSKPQNWLRSASLQLLLCTNARRCHMKTIPLPKPQSWSLMKHSLHSEVMKSLHFSSHIYSEKSIIPKE